MIAPNLFDGFWMPKFKWLPVELQSSDFVPRVTHYTSKFFQDKFGIKYVKLQGYTAHLKGGILNIWKFLQMISEIHGTWKKKKKRTYWENATLEEAAWITSCNNDNKYEKQTASQV